MGSLFIIVLLRLAHEILHQIWMVSYASCFSWMYNECQNEIEYKCVDPLFCHLCVQDNVAWLREPVSWAILCTSWISFVLIPLICILPHIVDYYWVWIFLEGCPKGIIYIKFWLGLCVDIDCCVELCEYLFVCFSPDFYSFPFLFNLKF